MNNSVWTAIFHTLPSRVHHTVLVMTPALPSKWQRITLSFVAAIFIHLQWFQRGYFTIWWHTTAACKRYKRPISALRVSFPSSFFFSLRYFPSRNLDTHSFKLFSTVYTWNQCFFFPRMPFKWCRSQMPRVLNLIKCMTILTILHLNVAGFYSLAKQLH